MNHRKYHINGGFFWMQGDAPVYLDSNWDIEVTNCYFLQRPKWYQLGQWYKIAKWILGLPHESSDAAAIRIENNC